MGGGNCLFGVTDKTTPIFRGNVSMVEVASVDTNPTQIPSTAVWRSGALSTAARCFDILCVGKCEGTSSSSKVKLNIQSAGRIPDFFTKNSEGKIVFSSPKAMGTIKAAKGHNSWIQIELKSINGGATDASDLAKHACLGVKKSDEEGFFDVIHAGHLVSNYVDVTQESHVELVPLLSKTATTESTGYIAVTPGDEVKFDDITIPTIGSFNFGSVFRISVNIHEGQWIVDQACYLSGEWRNTGRVGVGSVTDQHGNVIENQLVLICITDGTLAYSSDGVHWTKNSAVGESGWECGSAYGNGIWCIASGQYGVRRSIDGCRNWSESMANVGSICLHFANGIFVTVAGVNPSIVYTSSDAENWIRRENVVSGYHTILIYGDNKWIEGTNGGRIYSSKDGTGAWELISTQLESMSKSDGSTHWYYGGCYANGYFYVIRDDGLIARSSNAVDWSKVFVFSGGVNHRNITYYKNKLWAFNRYGQGCVVGLFNPDGTIDSLE